MKTGIQKSRFLILFTSLALTNVMPLAANNLTNFALTGMISLAATNLTGLALERVMPFKAPMQSEQKAKQPIVTSNTHSNFAKKLLAEYRPTLIKMASFSIGIAVGAASIYRSFQLPRHKNLSQAFNNLRWQITSMYFLVQLIRNSGLRDSQDMEISMGLGQIGYQIGTQACLYYIFEHYNVQI